MSKKVKTTKTFSLGSTSQIFLHQTKIRAAHKKKKKKKKIRAALKNAPFKSSTFQCEENWGVAKTANISKTVTIVTAL